MIDEATKTISITWCVQDVIDCAADYQETVLQEAEAWQILLGLYHNHNCNQGITSEHIQAAIDEYIETETYHRWNDGRD